MLNRFDVDERERVLLVQACQTVDLCTALREVLDAEGPIVVEGDRTKANPAAVELRQHRIVLARLLAALRIPVDELGDRTQPRGGPRGVYSLGTDAS